MSDVIEITKDLIRCASVTPKDEGAQQILTELLEEVGFEVHALPFGEGDERVENIFARIGHSGPHICYGGHTDVVPAGPEDKWSSPPFEPEIRDGMLYGRGASDMKGSVAAFTAAAITYVKEHGAPANGSISLLITGDEEAAAINGSAKVLEWMEEHGHIPDVAIVGEPTNPSKLGEQIKIGRRGSLTGCLTVEGKQGHVAYPERADNPLPHLLAMGHALASYKYDDGTDHFPPTNLEITTIDVGNSADNVIPAAGTMQFNLRFNDIWSHESLQEKIHEILRKISDEYELQFRCGAECFLTQPGDLSDLVVQAVEEKTGSNPALTTEGGTSDARFFSKYCPVVEFGPVNDSIHQIDECAKVSDLEDLCEIYQKIIAAYLK